MYFLLQPKELKLNLDESKALKEELGDVTIIQVHSVRCLYFKLLLTDIVSNVIPSV